MLKYQLQYLTIVIFDPVTCNVNLKLNHTCIGSFFRNHELIFVTTVSLRRAAKALARMCGYAGSSELLCSSKRYKCKYKETPFIKTKSNE